MNGAEGFVWYEHGMRHALVIPWWALLVPVVVILVALALRHPK